MGLKRSVAPIALVIILVAACNDDEGDLGLGVGGGDRYAATLTGANVRPSPVTTTATAAVTLTIRDPQIGSSARTVAVAINTTNLTSATAAHIHLGGASMASGQTLVTLFTNPTDTALTATQLVSRTLPESDLGVSIDSLAKLMSVGAAYVDVHTTASPGGLIRGQLVKQGQQAPGELFAAPSLTGAKERPIPVTTTATGSATFEVQGGSSVKYTVTVSGLTGAIMAHIHTAVADSAGPIVVTLFTSTTPTGPLTGTLASGTFNSSSIQLPGISLDSLLSLMRRGRTYVNVHTDANKAGEIRAQIDPVSVLP
jgi:hypothetical protein